jgi:hypothetical protein
MQTYHIFPNKEDEISFSDLIVTESFINRLEGRDEEAEGYVGPVKSLA